jgi:citrate synthase
MMLSTLIQQSIFRESGNRNQDAALGQVAGVRSKECSMTEERQPWIGASDAARVLGISRTTLYAYVSRGFLRSQASPHSPRERLYSHDDVERLRRRTEERRAPDKAAARALQWGMPILESSIALIDGHRLYYRGLDAAVLARTRSLEDVAALIWTGRFEAMPHVRSIATPPSPSATLPFVARAQALLGAAAAHDPLALDLRPAGVTATGVRVLRLLSKAAVGRQPGHASIDDVLARAWHIGDRGAGVVRAALVLCADHELNVSSFTARCVASAGSHPYAVVIAALSALEGPRHGGASARAESMIHSMRRAPSVPVALADRLRRGESIDGFGHPLYRDGDPRARVLFDLLSERYAKSAEYRFVAEFATMASEITGERPNVDFALAAVARVLKLPPLSPLMLFAIGRSVGWIGHALEQYETRQLIRPRAKYVGVLPAQAQ